MQRLAILIAIFMIFSTSAYAFGDEIGMNMKTVERKKGNSKFDKSRLFVGGGLNAGGLPGGYFVTGLPTVGYAFTERLHAGVQIGGTYYNNSPEPFYPDYKERGMNWQLAAFARFFVANTLFLQARPEYNSMKYFQRSLNNQGQVVGNPQRLGVSSFLVGAGYAQRIGGVSYGMFSVMYDVIQNPRSPYYRQPVFGGGIAIGLFGGR